MPGPSSRGHGPWGRWTVRTVGAGHNTVPCPDGVRKFSLESVPASPASSTLRLLGTRLGEAGKWTGSKGMPADAPSPGHILKSRNKTFLPGHDAGSRPRTRCSRVGMDWFLGLGVIHAARHLLGSPLSPDKPGPLEVQPHAKNHAEAVSFARGRPTGGLAAPPCAVETLASCGHAGRLGRQGMPSFL